MGCVWGRMSDPVRCAWGLLCAWRHIRSVGFGQTVQALSAVPMESASGPQPDFSQHLPGLSSTGGMAFRRRAATCGDCTLSSFPWLLRCPFFRKPSRASQNRVRDFPVTFPAGCRAAPSPTCVYSAFRALHPQFILDCTRLPSPSVFCTYQWSARLSTSGGSTCIYNKILL